MPCVVRRPAVIFLRNCQLWFLDSRRSAHYPFFMGRHSKEKKPPILREVVTSLPGLHHSTHRTPPEDLRPDEFVEISTGEDSPKSLGTLGHIVLGISFWVGWIFWTVYLWFFVGQPLNDVVIAFAVWAITFALVILGIPLMRRKARNRVHS